MFHILVRKDIWRDLKQFPWRCLVISGKDEQTWAMAVYGHQAMEERGVPMLTEGDYFKKTKWISMYLMI